jgi:sporulation protein YabP
MAYEEKVKSNHSVVIEGRRKLAMTGVEDIASFDENTVEAYTSMGLLTVKGSDLRINKLSVDTAELEVEGDIYSIEYSEEAQSGGFFKNLFK